MFLVFLIKSNGKVMNRFGETLIHWYEENKRDLPWRDTKDPYKIWISEIILQQTRVVQGYDYYCRFIRRFDYTAAAICSFAYGMPCAVVDGNVYRVLSRWLGVEEPIDTTQGKKLYAALAGELLEKSVPALYNQAIMDFGALQCVPSSPSCMFCPLADSCVALQKGLVDVLPRKQHKTKVSNRYFLYFYIDAGGDTFLHKREAGDIWHNLYEFPLIETGRAMEEEEVCMLPAYRQLFAECEILSVRLVAKQVKHVLSHRVIYADCYVVRIAPGGMPQGAFQCVPVGDLHKFAVPRLISRFFSVILKPNNQ